MAVTALILSSINLALTLGLLILVWRTKQERGAEADPRSANASSVGVQLQAFGQAQGQRLQDVQALLGSGLGGIDHALRDQERVLAGGLDRIRSANGAELERIRLQVGERLQETLQAGLKENSMQMAALEETTAVQQRELRESVRTELEKVRKENAEQLEKMRKTVDEKLQNTLEKRLGQSFQLVSDRLEQVHRGLGEMQTLATDVGGLKRVLSNVKNRGTFGEVLLARQLEDVLTPSQYEANVAIDPASAERVEYAVKLPGRGVSDEVLLPIDSKFPQEPYERLLSAQERGDTGPVGEATRDLEQALRTEAQRISNKYLCPPHSTDFAIMYLPTEGLFAEAVRIPGLASELQARQRVLITGPTTLMSLLNSLQMGFKTLAIEKRSSEVWQVLGAAKDEFAKYGAVWEKVAKQLRTVQNTVDTVGVRTRAVEKRLRDVESYDGPLEIEMLTEEIIEPSSP